MKVVLILLAAVAIISGCVETNVTGFRIDAGNNTSIRSHVIFIGNGINISNDAINHTVFFNDSEEIYSIGNNTCYRIQVSDSGTLFTVPC